MGGADIEFMPATLPRILASVVRTSISALPASQRAASTSGRKRAMLRPHRGIISPQMNPQGTRNFLGADIDRGFHGNQIGKGGTFDGPILHQVWRTPG